MSKDTHEAKAGCDPKDGNDFVLRAFVSSILSLTLIMECALTNSVAYAESASPAPVRSITICALKKDLTLEESQSLLMFNAQLTHLSRAYGKSGFDATLEDMVKKNWPKISQIQISPTYFERMQNIVNQQRLRDAIARTVGLDNPLWGKFEMVMKNITLRGQLGLDPMTKLEDVTKNLLRTIQSAQTPSSSASRVEAIARTSDMFTYLMRWRHMNGDIIDQRGDAAAKTVALLAVQLVGGSLLVSTLVISGPMLGGAGAIAATLSSNPVVASILVKVAETAAGSAIGFIGAPGARMLQDANYAMSEAEKQAANLQTDFSCELGKQTAIWKAQAGQRLWSAAMTGATMGAAGGTLTFTAASAKVILYATGLGVGVAQLYALGKMSSLTVQSVAYFKLAEDLEASGNHDQALRALFLARDFSQEAGESALEAVIIATLSYHLTHHFMPALREGQSAIRQLYAASADTIPTAAKDVENATSGLKTYLVH